MSASVLPRGVRLALLTLLLAVLAPLPAAGAQTAEVSAEEPAALVGRLAVDRRHAGRGLGSILLADAVLKTDLASQSLGIAVIVVDPLGAAARSFYRSFGFVDAVGSAQMYLVRKVGGSS